MKSHKTYINIIAILTIALVLGGCRRTAQDMIIGKWVAGQGGIKVQAQFERDGTAQLTMFGQTLRGTYKLEGDELVWVLNGITSKHKVKVGENELEVTGDGGATIIYKRE